MPCRSVPVLELRSAVCQGLDTRTIEPHQTTPCQTTPHHAHPGTLPHIPDPSFPPFTSLPNTTPHHPSPNTTPHTPHQAPSLLPPLNKHPPHHHTSPRTLPTTVNGSCVLAPSSLGRSRPRSRVCGERSRPAAVGDADLGTKPLQRRRRLGADGRLDLVVDEGWGADFGRRRRRPWKGRPARRRRRAVRTPSSREPSCWAPSWRAPGLGGRPGEAGLGGADFGVRRPCVAGDRRAGSTGRSCLVDQVTWATCAMVAGGVFCEADLGGGIPRSTWLVGAVAGVASALCT
ncbi:unnamed protein product [Closterium sp. NIES-54]